MILYENLMSNYDNALPPGDMAIGYGIITIYKRNDINMRIIKKEEIKNLIGETT